ncbi:hypothetical protein QJQ45_020778 [Haematococcus lacustris]|nr:hypothetical protein QJQ45_020778 [Haematococcus lacustris]
MAAGECYASVAQHHPSGATPRECYASVTYASVALLPTSLPCRRTRPSTALTDSGPLHQSVYGGSIVPGSKGHATPAAFVHGGPGQGHLTQGGSCSSTSETARADWERRMAAGGSGGLRGSLTPHWHPLEQADVTGTGSVATAQWSPGTTAYHVAGSTTMRKYLEEHQQPKVRPSLHGALQQMIVMSGKCGCMLRVWANPWPHRLRVTVARATGPAARVDDLGFATMRDGIKVAAEETLLTPRFYTTDFDEMERLFSKEINPNINMEELNACLAEFRQDYNKKHFVRNQTFAPAAAAIQGPTRKIFIEFLERSCTAEFSGFLLYKELARRLKDSAPEVAEMFLLTSRDEARHAGFINKALSDFNLALDLGFMTKNRTYTFFKPKFIIYATFLSEKIGYWRYISIYRHLQRNPDCQLYPLFEYFESWCQDENRHGDFLAAILKAKPELLQGWEAKLWSRFFCLSVYITMYLNDHQRTTFYESLGMNTTQFNRHVILETNRSTERLFPQVGLWSRDLMCRLARPHAASPPRPPLVDAECLIMQVPDVESPVFWERMDRLLELTAKLRELDGGSLPAPLKAIARLPILERLIANMLQVLLASVTQEAIVAASQQTGQRIFLAIFLISPKDCGSRDLESSIANLAV